MARVLLAGESWVTHTIHHKGFDTFTSTAFDTGADAFIAAAASQGIDIEQMYAHDVPARFPRTVEALAAYDVIIISDIGYNSFVLPNEVFLRGQPSANPLVALAEWTRAGGGLMMAGGYLSFQGFQAIANYARSPIADVLPVDMLTSDDRVEAPQGATCALVSTEHDIAKAWPAGAPRLLGYQFVTAKPDAEVVATVDGDILIATREVGSGRSLVWTSDIGPHWCPEEFLAWEGFAPVVAAMLQWLGASRAT